MGAGPRTRTASGERARGGHRRQGRRRGPGGGGHAERVRERGRHVRRGGRVVVVGVYAGESVELQLGVYWARALTLRFSGICPVHAWWGRAMDEVVAGRIDPSPLIRTGCPSRMRRMATRSSTDARPRRSCCCRDGGLRDRRAERLRVHGRRPHRPELGARSTRRRLLRPSLATLTAPDAGVAVTVRTSAGAVGGTRRGGPGGTYRHHSRLRSTAPADDRAVALRTARSVRCARAGGAPRTCCRNDPHPRDATHPRRLARLSSLLSVA